MNNLENLNERQREAVLHKDGPLLIIAGAGAGKTKTITHRIANLIKEGVNPENIMAITFTNKAASEMRERTFKLLNSNRQGFAGSESLAQAVDRCTPLSGVPGGQSKAIPQQRDMRAFGNNEPCPLISTFHSLGVRILKENFDLAGLPKHFTISGESDSVSLIREAIQANDLDPKQYEPRRIKNLISRQKGNFVTQQQFESNATDYLEKIIARVWQKYDELLKKEKSLDFDDLLLQSVLLLKDNSALRKRYHDRFKYLHIDEYQDTNEIQYELSKLLTGEEKNICVVGDSDQNIYSWRGATHKNIMNFEHDYPGAKVVLLEENYRSTQNILEAANEVIKKNKDRREKNLFTRAAGGEKISLYEAFDEADEADFVANKIVSLQDDGNRLDDMAILYRANFQSRALEEAMLSYNIAYQVLGTKFFERKEIKDILSYLKASLNPDSLQDIKRIINVPSRKIGKVTILKIFAGQKDTLPGKTLIQVTSFYDLLEKIKDYALANRVSDTIKYIFKETGLENSLKNSDEEDLERFENIKELVTLAKKYDDLEPEPGVEKLLEEAALMSDQDNLEQEKRGIKLMTVHASKGLEFKNVFIVGLEQGLFPHDRDSGSIEEKEEERRLFYVALTRAMKRVFLSYAQVRTIFGSRQNNMPSEFLSDIPNHLLKPEQKQFLSLKSIYL